jgi:A/G-specific adenine glycosylase
MLQQTTVRAVLPYYHKWMDLFPDLHSVARAPLQKILRAWQGLGYYGRARNLHQSARIILERHGGIVPDDLEALRRLPGFGSYTAAAVLSIAYGRPIPVIDANVRRVLMRIIRLEGEASPKNDPVIRGRLIEYFPARKGGSFNQALMELGALVCRSRNPQCMLCPVIEFCRAAREGKQEIIPQPKSQKFNKVEAVVAVIRKEGRYLIQKRPSRGLFAGLWEFPGGKIEEGESPRAALRREVREELGAGIRGIKALTTVKHSYTRFQVTLHVFLCEFVREPQMDKRNRRWVSLRAIRRYPLPSGSVKIVRFLERQKDHAAAD